MHEGIPTESGAEKLPIIMSREEFNKIRNTFGKDLENPEFKELLKKKGIGLDSGDVEIMVDGEKILMVTERGDFGTRIEEESERFKKHYE